MVLWVLKVLTGAEPEAARGAGGGPFERSYRRLAGACARDSLRACLTSVFGEGYPFREFC
jgi:hypothetical protein